MTIMNEDDLNTDAAPVCLVGHIKSVLIKEKTDSELKLALPKSEIVDLRELLNHTERPLQIIIRVGKDHA